MLREYVFESISSVDRRLVRGCEVLIMCLSSCEEFFFHVDLNYRDLMNICSSELSFDICFQIVNPIVELVPI